MDFYNRFKKENEKNISITNLNKLQDFKLYVKALEKYEKQNCKKTDKCKCTHENTVVENGTKSCLLCGEELSKEIMHEKEWRYYGSTDSKRSSDPNRVQLRKSEERNINKDVANMGFSEAIITTADKLYSQVTNGQIYRGNSRKAIVFACIFHAYKILGQHQTPENLIRLFGLNRKNGLKGLKIVNVNAPKDSKIHTTFITPVHLIHDVMDKFKATDEQKKEVIELYKKVKNRSSKLNRSRPQSVAASLTYYWICKTGIDITLKEFAKKVDLSELTIQKNAKEVSLVLKTPHII